MGPAAFKLSSAPPPSASPLPHSRASHKPGSTLSGAIKQLQAQANLRAKEVLADNAKELPTSAHIAELHHAGGPRGLTTAPHSSAQGGLAEQAIRLLTEATRAALHHAMMPLSFWRLAALDAAGTHSAWIATGAGRAPTEALLHQPPHRQELPLGAWGYAAQPQKQPTLQPRAALRRCGEKWKECKAID